MSLLEQTIAAIPAQLDRDAYAAAKERLANQARPAGSLGVMEDIGARLAAIKGSIDVKTDQQTDYHLRRRPRGGRRGGQSFSRRSHPPDGA